MKICQKRCTQSANTSNLINVRHVIRSIKIISVLILTYIKTNACRKCIEGHVEKICQNVELKAQNSSTFLINVRNVIRSM